MNLTRNEVLSRLGMILDRLNFIEGTKMIDEQVGLLGHGIGLDSIEILSVVAVIEDEFGLTLEDEELQVEYFRKFRFFGHFHTRETGVNILSNSIDEAFDERASQSGSRIAIRELDRDWSYADLLACSKKISHTLAFLGVTKGQRIRLMLPIPAAFLPLFSGLRASGVSLCRLIPVRVLRNLSYYLKDTSASVLVVASEVVRYAPRKLSGN